MTYPEKIFIIVVSILLTGTILYNGLWLITRNDWKYESPEQHCLSFGHLWGTNGSHTERRVYGKGSHRDVEVVDYACYEIINGFKTKLY